jgi:CMP-N,N'-diacetyllegionaminic acid synthase
MTSKIVAMIPVRKGSIRVPGKNTRPFVNTTLLDLKLKVLSGISLLDEIVVSTDCEQCMKIAAKHNVSIHRRDPYFAGSYVTNDLHWRHIAEITPGDVVFMAQVTSPFVRRSTFLSALNLFISSSEMFNSLSSVSLEKKFLWKDGLPVNYDFNKTPKSQDLPDIFSLNFAISIVDQQEMILRGNVVGSRPYFMQLEKIQSVDIDDESDFMVAEALYRYLGEEWLMDSV